MEPNSLFLSSFPPIEYKGRLSEVDLRQPQTWYLDIDTSDNESPRQSRLQKAAALSGALRLEWVEELIEMSNRKLRPATRGGVKIEVENVNVPGYVTRVDERMYCAMRTALLALLPTASPGLTQREIRERVAGHLPAELFPDGSKAAWWSKTVQLDLEAKGIVVRESCKPLRWHKG